MYKRQEYGSGQSVDSVVPGTESTVNPTTTAPVTTVTTSATTILTTTEATTTTTVSTSVVPDPTSGTKVVDVNKKLDYSSDTENILQIKISDLLPSGAKAEKFIVKLSASGNIGSPSISGGINVTNNDDYWLDLDGTQKISGSTGTIEFDVKSCLLYTSIKEPAPNINPKPSIQKIGVPKQKSIRFFIIIFPAFFALVKPVSTIAKPACIKKTNAAPNLSLIHILYWILFKSIPE